MFGFRVPDVDEVMLISGKKSKDDKQFEIVRGSRFIFPGMPRKVAFLSLAQRKSVIEETCNTTQGLPITLTATVAFKIGREDAAIYAAGERFRDDQRREVDMANQTGGIFAGHLRAIAGDMTFEDMMRNRQELADKVLIASKNEVSNMGLLVDSFQINQLVGPSDYVEAVSAPQRAAVAQAAAIAQAMATQASAQAEQESLRKQAEYKRETLVVQAQYQAQVDKEKETAAQAGPLAQAQAQQAVLQEQELLASRQASLRQAQLQTEVIKPAEVEASRVKIEAEAQAGRTLTVAKANADMTTMQADADAHKMSVQAAALAAEGKVTMERMLIEQLPEIVKAAAGALANANLTVFNGQEGVNQTLTGLASQGMSIFNTLRSHMDGVEDKSEARAITSDPQYAGVGVRTTNSK